MLSIEFADEHWMLSPLKAVYWPRKKSLIVADLHFGKAAMFRERGVPVPVGTTAHDLLALTKLLKETGAHRLVILGDFFHGKVNASNPTLKSIGVWRETCNEIEILLIRGNHDRSAGDPCGDWNIRCENGPYREDGIAFTHEPCKVRGSAVLCGHVHPCVHLADFDGTPTRIPCFAANDSQMMLPAFGRFTGTHPVSAKEYPRIYIAAAGKVLQLPTRKENDGVVRNPPTKRRAAKAGRTERPSA